MARVAQIDLAQPRKRHAVTAVPGRHHAIEHVDAARHRLQQIFRRADAHQIARAIRRQHRRGLLDHRQHHRLRLADRQAADGIAVKADLDQARARWRGAARARRRPARCRTACSRQARSRTRACCARPSATTAASRARCRRAPPAAARTRRAASRCRSRAGAAPRSSAPATVRSWRRRYGAERDRLFGDLAQLRQRHHLEAAGVRQHRPVPAGEFLQAAQRCDPLGAGPQHQMIGVAEHDIGAGIAHLAPMQALHCAGGADRHEGRRAGLITEHGIIGASGAALAPYRPAQGKRP